MVRSIDKNDFDRRFPKRFGRSQTTKTAADDHHPRCLRRLHIRTIDRIEISIVHPSLSQASGGRNFRESPVFNRLVAKPNPRQEDSMTFLDRFFYYLPPLHRPWSHADFRKTPQSFVRAVAL